MKYNHVGCIRSRASIFGTVLFVSVKPQVVAELFRPIACYNVWPHNSDDWFMTLISIVKWDEMVLQTNLQLGGPHCSHYIDLICGPPQDLRLTASCSRTEMNPYVFDRIPL